MYSFQTANQSASWPQILTVALLAIGAVAVRWDIQTDRPEPSGQGISTRGIQNIDARLWQDPFGPAFKNGQAAQQPSHDLRDLPAMAHVPPGRVRVIAALVSGGTWVRADESRRRARYAILSGLQVEDYEPHDPEHIGYAKYADEDSSLSISHIPYEWLELRKGVGGNKPELLLVLWLDESALLANTSEKLGDWGASRPRALSRLQGIRSIFGDSSFDIIGPSSSTFLVAVDEEIKERKHSREELVALLPKVRWHSPLATIANSHVPELDRISKASNPPFQFTRLIATDEQLTHSLFEELTRRHLGKNDAVALVFQRDTEYSRALLRQAKTKLEDLNIALIEVGYLRGIDGLLPGSKNTRSEKKNDKSNDKKDAVDSLERPEGDAQTDYLRRLVASLERRQAAGAPIKAIGIFGDDYYDKLMVVKALRPAFPQAIFFTTDLDAAMLHPKDNHHLRNLVVASGYGLSLNAAIQKDVLPFRDSYQTAAFLAARQAASTAGTVAIPAPQIFEVGRSAIIPLTGPTREDGCTELEKCGSLQLPMAIPPWAAALPLPFLMAALLLASFLNKTIKSEQARPWIIALAFTALASCCLVYLLRAYPATSEPLDWVQGISTWPSTMLRFLAALLALVLILRGRQLLAENHDLLEKRFYLPPSSSPKAEPDKTRRVMPAWPQRCRKAIKRLFRTQDSPDDQSENKASVCDSEQEASSGGALSAVDIWRRYTAGEKDILPGWLRSSHLWTMGGFSAFMLLIAGLSMLLFPGPSPNLPARGDLAFYAHWAVLIAAVTGFWTLLFFALDQTLRANCLARLHSGQTIWPEENYKKFWPDEGKAEQKIFTDWLDARLIAHATEPIQRIVFYPFLVLALLILARSSLFDNWDMPFLLYVMFGVPILLMIGAAWPLRDRAEKVRATALRWLHVRLMEERAKGREPSVKQIESMIEQVKNLRTGAFAPFSERPLFKGVLTLVGTLSGVALMDYAHLFGL